MDKPKEIADDSPELKLYRAGVGIVLLNRVGCVFVGERLDNKGAWQMPQGGIDAGEEPEVAVFRELKEEVGTKNARIIAVMGEWISYDIPDRTAKKLWGGKYKGQRQKWIALEFLGSDDEIDLAADDHPEFSKWKWVEMANLLDYVVPFKRDVYRRVMKEFAPVAEELKKKNGA
ncbi:MAG TPA: RNA pyrophosphohydrolase [Patescibacteria group bacterium]|nr:RNA pyrophosphohydrolase [Patescibacteria group bacterium]